MQYRAIAIGLAVTLGVVLSTGPLPAGPDPEKPSPVAEVDGEAVTAEEIDQAIAIPLRRLEEQILALRRQRIEVVIADRLLAREAARRGIPVATLLEVEVTAKADPVTDEEIERQRAARGGQAGTREQVRDQLLAQRQATRRQALVESLRSRAVVSVRLPALPELRLDVSGDAPFARGPAGAAVTLVEFTDFHCPFCKRVQPTIAELQARYGARLRHVHRDFPIDRLHPRARAAHEAARCAGDQGAFWAFRQVLFANAPRTGADRLEELADDLGLDVPAFAHCVKAGTHRAAVQSDVDEGLRLGVSGTPAFFVNGRPFFGAQPVERFVRVIEDELSRLGVTPASSTAPGSP